MNDYTVVNAHNHESPRAPVQPVLEDLDAGKEKLNKSAVLIELVVGVKASP